MKPYMAFSREAGPQDGAILVIAGTAKEARKLAWQSRDCLNVDDWLDQAVLRIRNTHVLALANQEKLHKPHVVWNPLHCKACGLWGQGLTVDGLCGYCNEEPGDELKGLLSSKSE